MVDNTLELKVDEKGKNLRVEPTRHEETGNSFYTSLTIAGGMTALEPSTRGIGIPLLIMGLSPYALPIFEKLGKTTRKITRKAYTTLTNYLHSP